MNKQNLFYTFATLSGLAIVLSMFLFNTVQISIPPMLLFAFLFSKKIREKKFRKVFNIGWWIILILFTIIIQGVLVNSGGSNWDGFFMMLIIMILIKITFKYSNNSDKGGFKENLSLMKL